MYTISFPKLEELRTSELTGVPTEPLHGKHLPPTSSEIPNAEAKQTGPVQVCVIPAAQAEWPAKAGSLVLLLRSSAKNLVLTNCPSYWPKPTRSAPVHCRKRVFLNAPSRSLEAQRPTDILMIQKTLGLCYSSHIRCGAKHTLNFTAGERPTGGPTGRGVGATGTAMLQWSNLTCKTAPLFPNEGWGRASTIPLTQSCTGERGTMWHNWCPRRSE